MRIEQGVEAFFERKRAWSRIKDEILEYYLQPYLAKVKDLHKPVLLIDGYAGPGRYGDGSYGSPLIMCRTADKIIPGRYTAIFVNKRRSKFEMLERNIEAFEPTGKIVMVHGAAEEVLDSVNTHLDDQTVFAYLDHFRTPDFRTAQLLLSRHKRFSTEVVVNLNAQEMPRLAAMQAARRSASSIHKLNSALTARLGGEYWRAIFADDSVPNEPTVCAIAAEYCSLLSASLPYTGCCPVRETSTGPIKYFIVFCSRHQDAMLLMNDAMFRAYHQGMHASDTQGSLLSLFDWRTYRCFADPPPVGIKRAILEQVAARPGRSRRSTWVEIVRKYFMAFDHSEYRKAVSELVGAGRLMFSDVKGTGRLNDDSILYLREEGPDGTSEGR